MAIGQAYEYLFDAYSDAAAAADAGAERPSSFHAYCDRDAAMCANHLSPAVYLEIIEKLNWAPFRGHGNAERK